MVIPSSERINQSKYIFRKSIMYFIKKPIQRIPKNQGRYSQMIYLSKTIKSTYKTNKKMSVFRVSWIKTLALCQMTWKISSTCIYFFIICFLNIEKVGIDKARRRKSFIQYPIGRKEILTSILSIGIFLKFLYGKII